MMEQEIPGIYVLSLKIGKSIFEVNVKKQMVSDMCYTFDPSTAKQQQIKSRITRRNMISNPRNNCKSVRKRKRKPELNCTFAAAVGQVASEKGPLYDVSVCIHDCATSFGFDAPPPVAAAHFLPLICWSRSERLTSPLAGHRKWILQGRE